MQTPVLDFRGAVAVSNISTRFLQIKIQHKHTYQNQMLTRNRHKNEKCSQLSCTCFSKFLTTSIVKTSTLVLTFSSCVVLLVGDGIIAVITALFGVLIGLECQVALNENSVSGLRNRSWWALLYSFWVAMYAFSVEFSRPQYKNHTSYPEYPVFGTNFSLSKLALGDACFAIAELAKINNALNDTTVENCEDSLSLEIGTLAIISVFTIFSFLALRAFAKDMDIRRRGSAVDGLS